jgi:hypothetical protein
MAGSGVKQQKLYNAEISSYSVKGEKPLLEVKPDYHVGSIIKNNLPTFDVKCYSEDRSQGIKKVW